MLKFKPPLLQPVPVRLMVQFINFLTFINPCVSSRQTKMCKYRKIWHFLPEWVYGLNKRFDKDRLTRMREIIKNTVYMISRRCTAVKFIKYVVLLRRDFREGKEIKIALIYILHLYMRVCMRKHKISLKNWSVWEWLKSQVSLKQLSLSKLSERK